MYLPNLLTIFSVENTKKVKISKQISQINETVIEIKHDNSIRTVNQSICGKKIFSHQTLKAPYLGIQSTSSIILQSSIQDKLLQI